MRDSEILDVIEGTFNETLETSNKNLKASLNLLLFFVHITSFDNVFRAISVFDGIFILKLGKNYARLCVVCVLNIVLDY